MILKNISDAGSIQSRDFPFWGILVEKTQTERHLNFSGRPIL
jgi:hypothetical protein